MRPFDRFTSIRAKLGSAIVLAVGLTVLIMFVTLVSTLHLSGGFYKSHSLVRSAWWLLPTVGAAAAIVSLGLVRLLARGMTKPLRDMEQAAARMARGEQGVRVMSSSRDEVGRLADAFNHMASELEKMERMRRELVANVSHELKTPISAIRAHLENLLEGVEEPNPETLAVMVRQSERLSKLIEQLLDLSGLESGDVPLHLEPVSLGPLVEQAAEEAAIARVGRKVVILNDVPGDLPVLQADRQRVHQVIFNLLDNATRFSPVGGTVRVAARRHEGVVEVSVDDAGPGIPSDQIPLVFERFYRVDSARSRNDGGAGLGLAISRSIVEGHGGKIWASSGPSGGSRFTFTLPAPPARDASRAS